MMNFSQIAIKRQRLQQKIDSSLEDVYFDIQGMSTSYTSLDEAYLARVLTKLAIGTATVWWSALEVKDFFVLRRKSKTS